MDGQDDPDSGCHKCTGSCDCSNPTETPDSSDSDSDLIVFYSTEENFAPGPHQTSILSLVKSEPTERSTDDQAEPMAGTSLEVQPFKTKWIEWKKSICVIFV